MSKIIFLDIDGTIRDFSGLVPETAIESIRAARKNGHKVCLSTGRTLGQIEEKIKQIGFDGIVSGSGSYVEYDGKCVRYECFIPEKYIALGNYLKEHGCLIEIQTSKGVFILKEDLQEFKAIRKKIQKNLNFEIKDADKIPQLADSLEEIENVEKMLFFSDQLSNAKLKEDWGSEFYIVPHSFPAPTQWGGEITPIHVNKAEGIQSILNQSEYSVTDVIAIGDSENDIEMIRMASIGVAMGNGTPKLKEEADLITDSVTEDGIQKVFQKLQLI